MFAKYDRGKPEDVGILVLPAIRRHLRLDAGFFKKLHSIPVLLHGNLGKQKSFVVAVFHQQPMLTDLYFMHVEHASQRR